MDLRIQKTRQNIFQAFIELREKYPLEKITVKELTERARSANRPSTCTTGICTTCPNVLNSP